MRCTRPAAVRRVSCDGCVQKKWTRRMALRRHVLAEALRRRPEKLVERARETYVEEQRKKHVPLAVVDVPLLYETGGETNVDAVLLAHAERHVRMKRALERPGMTREKLDMILARQWTDQAKLMRADYVIHTTGDLADVEAQLDEILAHIRTHGIATP